MKLIYDSRQRKVIYGLFALFFIWMAWQLPYTHDDWDWGLPNGIQLLVNASINSRYAGNFTEVVITRSPVLKALVMGLTLFLIPFLGSRIVTRRGTNRQKELRMPLFLAGTGLLLSIERRIWRQAVAWVAGFANFGFSCLFVLIFLLETVPLFDEEKQEEASGYRCVGLFLLCCAMQLFIENLTVYMLLLSLAVCVYARVKEGRWSGRYLSMALGCLAGTAIMFSSSLYGTLFTTGEAIGGYRQLTFTAENGLFKSLYIFVRQVVVYLMPSLWGDNTVLSIAICGLLFALVRGSDKPAVKKWGKPLMGLNFFLMGYFLSNHLNPVEPNPDAVVTTIVRFVANGLFFLVVTAETWLLFRDNKPLLLKSLLMWVSAIGVIAPLALTSETGQRLFFTSDVFLTLFALYLARELMGGSLQQKFRTVTTLLLAVAVILCSFYGGMYAKVGAVTREREAIIRRAVAENRDTVTLPLYPYEDYLYWPTPVDDTYLGYFKDFYGIPGDMEVAFE